MSDDSLLPRRRPTLAGFFSLGLFWGAWAAVLPSVQHATGLSKGALGVAMLFVSVGSIPVMFLLAPRAIDRFGARSVAVGCAFFAVATLLPGLATGLPGLVVALAACGMASGLVDVSINANVGRIENVTGRRLQPFAHGTYSIGVLVGAVSAGLARNAGVGRETILIAVSIVIALTALLVSTDHARVHAGRSKGLRLAHGLVAIGLVGAVAFVVEGGTESWSALFLERQLHTDPAVSGLGPGVFAAAMAAGRFSGQAAGRFSDRLLLGGGAGAGGARLRHGRRCAGRAARARRFRAGRGRHLAERPDRLRLRRAASRCGHRGRDGDDARVRGPARRAAARRRRRTGAQPASFVPRARRGRGRRRGGRDPAAVRLTAMRPLRATARGPRRRPSDAA